MCFVGVDLHYPQVAFIHADWVDRDLVVYCRAQIFEQKIAVFTASGNVVLALCFGVEADLGAGNSYAVLGLNGSPQNGLGAGVRFIVDVSRLVLLDVLLGNQKRYG